ncbi:tRNA 2-thiocytidine(32) synthetase TtcA [Solemya pervernicosa gill symbiont]|uniref:tRNA 2-thiocytidine(32) synthetase TtcA n=2 Tax=Gammaproteobacteria incertae sedis TaxID=118884 RepID=A0A1T2L835_9GAMM|nr:ATP-binding protein [Candidatus Reidiella endopervernicosa]OOZ41269.1 tRNA 2-thiocytidine(32) synthetase TtcA [Solemya pervernicosa gill symbiont]QKQ25244.1 tRNA 2-thiocytidine biosynthesis protein TtcA [Candidatus Reidiella endopervernicosa]
MTIKIKPPKGLLRPVGRAIGDYTMIREGDRVMLGLSGGKDSLSLLHILIHLQRHAPIHFDLAAVTVDPQHESFDPSPLKAYLAELGIPYFYISQPIAEEAMTHQDEPKFSYCAYCSRMKRGILYTTLRNEGYNVLALAQHLDDLAESFLMSAFYRGQLRTMKAHYLNDAGDVRIIRPLVYARERQTAEFAREAELPVIFENCPACFEKPTERYHMKKLLAGEEQHNKQLFKTMLAAMRPLMDENMPE